MNQCQQRIFLRKFEQWLILIIDYHLKQQACEMILISKDVGVPGLLRCYLVLFKLLFVYISLIVQNSYLFIKSCTLGSLVIALEHADKMVHLLEFFESFIVNSFCFFNCVPFFKYKFFYRIDKLLCICLVQVSLVQF